MVVSHCDFVSVGLQEPRAAEACLRGFMWVAMEMVPLPITRPKSGINYETRHVVACVDFLM
jgi:hypothetical protein